MDLLVNPVWHALDGPQSDVAEAHRTARRFVSDVAVFGAVPDEPDDDDWDALRTLVGAGGQAFLLREPVTPPDSWDVGFRLDAVQMIADTAGSDAHDTQPDIQVVDLTRADVPEMMTLVARTEPGPFRERGIELGTFVGVRVDGALVAMAGERIRPPGSSEVSAVCTDPAYRGRGFAALLVRVVMAQIRTRGEHPILHAAATNTDAIRLYEALGFRHSREVEGVALLAPA